MAFKRKIPKDRDLDFNNCERKVQRELLFRELSKVLQKHQYMTRNDIFFVLALLKHKILENKRDYT